MSLPIHNTNTRVLYVDGLPCVIDSAERFALILEEKLGMDFADYFRNYAANCVDASTCEGECDVTYGMQERYEEAINSALELLKDCRKIKPERAWDGRVDREMFRRAVEILKSETTT